MADSDSIGFLMRAVNGQPPHMMAIQNMMTTDAIKHCVKIGVGGLTLAPTASSARAPTTAASDRRDQAEQNAADGLERSAAKRGCFIPHVTPMTISMGMMQIRHSGDPSGKFRESRKAK